MLRSGLNKFSIARKPIALKPLPQVENSQPSPRNSEIHYGDADAYSSTYGRNGDDGAPLMSLKPSMTEIGDSSSPLPPKEFCTTSPSKRRQIIVQSAIFLVVFLTIFTPLYVTRKVIYPLSQNAGNLPFFDCTYSGDFSFEGIDAPFGKMQFGEAKSIDLAFNTIIGRGLQTLLAWVCYRLFNAILMHITEKNRINYELYAALALTPAQIDSLKPTVKSLFTKLPGFVKFQIFWLLLTTLYLALFPILIDSISGYQAIQSTMFKLPNGTMLPTPLRNFIYTIDEDEFINPDIALQNIYKYVPSNTNGINFTFSVIGAELELQYWSPSPAVYVVNTNSTYNPFNTTLTEDWSTIDVYGNGTYTSACINTSTSSVFELKFSRSTAYSTIGSDDISIIALSDYGSPVLNYTDDSCDNWFHLQDGFAQNIYLQLNTNQSSNQSSDQSTEQSFNYYEDLEYAYTPAWNVSYFLDRDNYECVSKSKLQYQWGFSYEFLLIASCINSFWLLGTYAIYIHASNRSQLTTKGRKFGLWRAVVDLAGTLREDLGTETSAYGDDELEKEVNRLGKEGRGVKYSVSIGGSYEDEGADAKDNPRLALSSSGSDARVRLLSGRVYC